ncbi:Sperm flagellar protein 1 [Globomyces sp. JEL0801]|nr:Sperm flagellar protein 1 [Globomyces sp. JEL0801]
MFELNEQEIQKLYTWIDSAQFSRPKKNLTRDFSDGDKVFKKLGYQTSEEIIKSIVAMRPGYIEYLLYDLRNKVQEYLTQIPSKTHLETLPKESPTNITPRPKSKLKLHELEMIERDPLLNPIVKELNETIRVLSLKVTKLEELLELKDHRIHDLLSKLQRNE